uniref:SJCHGC04337 protein n=1 Tax=Schistosoma japonicum TaxID=6182 RepID=Q5DGF0_SCHJA|nr:SJCHGC04337 protein [Schistosoma japonicum]
MSSIQKDIAKQEDEEREDDEEKVFWTEENFVPGPERKRARLVMPGTKSSNVALNELLQSTNTEVISINQSDLTAGAQLELIKSVTSDDSQYRPKSTDDDPGKLAHRKHQITWLAHQAQENEMELGKRWAEARRNKASNRAKYGF